MGRGVDAPSLRSGHLADDDVKVFPHHPGKRMQVAEVRLIGDVILARYLLDATNEWAASPGGDA
ncbi:hypothetical protein ACFY4C_35870 [Actinomadura viridis]|uniref:hypothetical protein n=1 Tax=Actinomadura viridis TaxID=58110 RepID=UPI00367BEF19